MRAHELYLKAQCALHDPRQGRFVEGGRHARASETCSALTERKKSATGKKKKCTRMKERKKKHIQPTGRVMSSLRRRSPRFVLPSQSGRRTEDARLRQYANRSFYARLTVRPPPPLLLLLHESAPSSAPPPASHSTPPPTGPHVERSVRATAAACPLRACKTRGGPWACPRAAPRPSS